MKDYLKNDILSFWLKYGIDSKNGGIFTSVERNGDLFGREKSVWFQGRALWVFSKAYNLVEKDPAYLAAAKTLYDFLPKCTDNDGRMYFTVTEDGRGLQKRRYYFSELFAAIGCAEYYKATNDKQAIGRAEKYFDTAFAIFKNPSLTVPKLNPENAPFKALSPVMILINTAQIMITAGQNTEKYGKICDELCNEILHGGYINDELGAVLEQVTLDGKFYDSPSTRVVNPGHSLECAWFLMMTGVMTKNDEAIAAGKKIIDFTMPRGLDEKHGGIIAFTDVLHKPPLALEWDMKLWWPQCEAIIANRMAYSLFGENKYDENYRMLCDYAMTNFADKEYGEWYGYLHYDNTVATTLKGNIFKGPFHIPRLAMVMYDFDKNGKMKEFYE